MLQQYMQFYLCLIAQGVKVSQTALASFAYKAAKKIPN
jgi:hypothetical protein